ncbi:MAG: hypothetical protein GY906_23475 [bacterium]|nr:hypothetical protein [bacterium]
MIADMPWSDVAGLGAGGIALLMCYLFLKHMSQARQENTKALDGITTTFAEASKDNHQQVANITKSFEETAVSINKALIEELSKKKS